MRVYQSLRKMNLTVQWPHSHNLWPIIMHLLANLTKSCLNRTKEEMSRIILWKTMILSDCTLLSWIVWLLKICHFSKLNSGLLLCRCISFCQIHPCFQRDWRKSSLTLGLVVQQWSSSTLSCKISTSNNRSHSRLSMLMKILLLSWSNQWLSSKKAQLR